VNRQSLSWWRFCASPHPGIVSLCPSKPVEPAPLHASVFQFVRHVCARPSPPAFGSLRPWKVTHEICRRRPTRARIDCSDRACLSLFFVIERSRSLRRDDAGGSRNVVRKARLLLSKRFASAAPGPLAQPEQKIARRDALASSMKTAAHLCLAVPRCHRPLDNRGRRSEAVRRTAV